MLLDVVAVERCRRQGLDHTVHADRRWQASHEIQVAARIRA
jgi:hypothetical protein